MFNFLISAKVYQAEFAAARGLVSIMHPMRVEIGFLTMVLAVATLAPAVVWQQADLWRSRARRRRTRSTATARPARTDGGLRRTPSHIPGQPCMRTRVIRSVLAYSRRTAWRTSSSWTGTAMASRTEQI